MLASLIAAAGLRPREQLPNRVTEGRKDIASVDLTFLCRFHDSARWLSEADEIKTDANIKVCSGSETMNNYCVTHPM